MGALRQKIQEGGMKKYLVLGLSVVAVLFAMPLTAAENTKIKLPEGLYLYDAIVPQAED
jgi:hypothetical protein